MASRLALGKSPTDHDNELQTQTNLSERLRIPVFGRCLPDDAEVLCSTRNFPRRIIFMIIPTEPIGSIPRPLVEDHLDTAAILARLLRRMGHDVLPASSVSAALALAKKEMRLAPIDIVMSDLGLPDGSGLDLMRRLSGDYGLRGIALRGFGMDSDLEQSTAAGFSRHLVKPIDISTLRATLLEMTSGA